VGPIKGGPDGLVKRLRVVSSTHLIIPFRGEPEVAKRLSRYYQDAAGAKRFTKKLGKIALRRLKGNPCSTRTCDDGTRYGTIAVHEAVLAMSGVCRWRAPGTAAGLVLYAARECSSGTTPRVAVQLLQVRALHQAADAAATRTAQAAPVARRVSLYRKHLDGAALDHDVRRLFGYCCLDGVARR
jgi:hypothetical protein